MLHIFKHDYRLFGAYRNKKILGTSGLNVEGFSLNFADLLLRDHHKRLGQTQFLDLENQNEKDHRQAFMECR
jgi:hypothetical protein